MLKVKQWTIDVIPHPHKGYEIGVIHSETGEVAPIPAFAQDLFMWHDLSYFGQQLTPSVFQPETHIWLTGWELVQLFSNEQFSSIVQWDFTQRSEAFLGISPVIYDSVLGGHWIPDFDAWSNELDYVPWGLPGDIWEEFGEDFWEQELDGQSYRELTQDLFQQTVSSFIKREPSLKTLSTKLQSLQEANLTSDELHAYFDEESWRKWTGLEAATEPYTIGLRLEEPPEDEEDWVLSPFVRSVKSPDQLYVVGEDRLPSHWKNVRNDIKQEQKRWSHMFSWLTLSLGKPTYVKEHEAWQFLTEGSEKLVHLGVEILLPRWWEALREQQLAVKAKVKSMETSYRPSFVGLNALVDFDWRLSMNGVELSEEQFQQLVEEQRRLVQVNGQWMKLDPEMIARIQAYMEKARERGIRMQDLLQQELVDEEELEDEFDPLAFAKVQIELNRSLKGFVKQLTNLESMPEVKVDEWLEGSLRPYQQQGVNWLSYLRQFRFGGVLADDMGLGKTIQLISYLLHVKNSENPSTPALIVAPTSVVGNWQKEIERFAPSLRVMQHYGPNRGKEEGFLPSIQDVDVVLTTYGISHLDEAELGSIEWSTIALDEAQNIKNAQTKQSKAIRALRGTHQLALTGTPMENRLSELWSIFDFTNHGYLGTFNSFQKHYILPIEKEENEQRIRQLQKRIKPFLLRRTKRDPEVELNLPDKIEQKEYCPLTPEQASLYEQVVNDTLEKIQTLSAMERRGLILQMLNKLKQLCNHPALYLKEEAPAGIVERASKMQKLMELVDSIVEQKEACLIFTQYIGMGEMIRTILKARYDLTVPFLHGGISKSQREQMVEQFQAGEFPVFLLSLKAGGTGLNLTEANHVIHYDRWWNPAVENQATDRAYRIGQKRFVHVHKMISTGTLEEKIDAMLEKKQSLNEEIIQSDHWVTELSNLELAELVSLTK